MSHLESLGPPAPLPSNFLPVPVVRQRRGFSCGPAAVLSLLRHWFPEAYATVWDAGHYVIMVGYDDDRLFFVDPSNASPAGYVYLPRTELDERWHDLTGHDEAPVRRMTIFARGERARPPAASPSTEASPLG